MNPELFYPGWWHDPQALEKVLRQYGTGIAAMHASKAAGVSVSYKTILHAATNFGIELKRGIGYTGSDEHILGVESAEVDEKFKQLVHLAIVKAKDEVSVFSLADKLDVPPSRIRDVIQSLRQDGVMLSDVDDTGHLSIERVTPGKRNLYQAGEIGLELLRGNVVRFGVVSDTHLNSNEEALEPLHIAYDMFVEEGIETVFHAGDIGDGIGVYRGQMSEITNVTYETQREHLIKNYPQRKNIRTVGIGGNHDAEGKFGDLGIDMFRAVSNMREDIEWLGGFSAFVNIHTEEAPCWLHLLHGKGGMSYAYSYKAQKIVEKYTDERKPQILIPGHWHVHGSFNVRGVNVLFPGCFQWMSSYIERHNLEPAVGFHIVTATIGEDGQIVRWLPEWFRFVEGRKITKQMSLV